MLFRNRKEESDWSESSEACLSLNTAVRNIFIQAKKKTNEWRLFGIFHIVAKCDFLKWGYLYSSIVCASCTSQFKMKWPAEFWQGRGWFIEAWILYNRILLSKLGRQWLIGRVLDSRPKGRGFEPHRRHCVVVLEQNTFMLA